MLAHGIQAFEKIPSFSFFYSAREMRNDHFKATKPTPPSKLTQILRISINRTNPPDFTMLPLPVDLNGHLPHHFIFPWCWFHRILPQTDPLFSLLTIKSQIPLLSLPCFDPTPPPDPLQPQLSPSGFLSFLP